MTRYTVAMSAAELNVVTLALGRMLDAKPIVERANTRPKAAPRRKPPTLGRGQFGAVAERWAKAVADPSKWHHPMICEAGRNTNREAHTIERAWGIVTPAGGVS